MVYLYRLACTSTFLKWGSNNDDNNNGQTITVLSTYLLRSALTRVLQMSLIPRQTHGSAHGPTDGWGRSLASPRTPEAALTDHCCVTSKQSAAMLIL